MPDPVRDEEREACYSLIRFELDATEAALKNATGAFFEECLVAKKVLQHAAEKIASRRLSASGTEDEANLLRSPEGHVVARLDSGKAGWTKERPTKPGFYFLRIAGDPSSLCVDDVRLMRERLRVHTMADDGSYGWLPIEEEYDEDWEWLPIPVPEE